ncbi:uncharacterized protein [Vicugna pacos]|uniref:Uncharacterized protein isoform X2 n=1 Tax=Vicugna pacos TaxID=30538 RepID=A0ABM5BZ57_VICPA
MYTRGGKSGHTHTQKEDYVKTRRECQEWLRRPSGIRQFLKYFMHEKGTCRRPQHCGHLLVAVREILTRQMAPCGLERITQFSRPLSDSSGESGSLVSTYSGVIYGNNQESRFLHPERSCTAIM